ncbi:hypothetical protein EV379_1550 [Microterricola gilva]|uniref:Protein-tyrosine-phosphatase-like N-terminal domain-containing protein n=1 Tax=Microterricola gilva TaxID=393267 RepID=A0A4Q8AMQ4_9MICO|nr:hypothetical protein [Microterricola gilva]RZU65225.1 hypothetical protein EV379_1550 [Microterricola gilva]
MTTDLSDDEIKRQVSAKLASRFPELGEASIRAVVDEEFRALAEQPIRDFLVVLTERAAKDRLKKHTQEASS